MCFKIDWVSLIAGRKFTVFDLFYFVFEGNFQVQAPPGGAYIWRGDLTGGFCVMSLGGLYLQGFIHGRSYFRNFTVVLCRPKGQGFGPFWFENGYRLCPFWSGIGYGFRTNYRSV